MKGECFDCGGEAGYGVWEDFVLAGIIKLKCEECANEQPEDILWDMKKLEEKKDSSLIEDKLPIDVLEENDDLVPNNEGFSIHKRKSGQYDLVVEDTEDEDLLKRARSTLESMK